MPGWIAATDAFATPKVSLLLCMWSPNVRALRSHVFGHGQKMTKRLLLRETSQRIEVEFVMTISIHDEGL